MADKDSDYEFYVGAATHLEGASLAIEGTARIAVSYTHLTLPTKA